jgi:hypothetical protein
MSVFGSKAPSLRLFPVERLLISMFAEEKRELRFIHCLY